ncbi:MAG: hypothetical protein ACRC3B_23825, partial [Bacteroidia bacterium]
MAKEEISFSADAISMLSLTITKSLLEYDFDFNNEEIDSFEFEYSFDLKISPESEQIKTVFQLKIETVSNIPQKEASGVFEFVYLYKVDEISRYIKASGGNYKMKPVLANSIAAITYSTSRGVLMMQTRNSAIEKFIL